MLSCSPWASASSPSSKPTRFEDSVTGSRREPARFRPPDPAPTSTASANIRIVVPGNSVRRSLPEIGLGETVPMPPQQRLPSLGSLIARKAYFVVHAPRQSGKSTCFHHLARELTAEGRYAAQLASCETARTVSGDVDRAVNVVVRAIEIEAGRDLPQELRPPPAESVHHIDAETRLNHYLGTWCQRCPRPVVLFLDAHRRESPGAQ